MRPTHCMNSNIGANQSYRPYRIRAPPIKKECKTLQTDINLTCNALQIRFHWADMVLSSSIFVFSQRRFKAFQRHPALGILRIYMSSSSAGLAGTVVGRELIATSGPYFSNAFLILSSRSRLWKKLVSRFLIAPSWDQTRIPSSTHNSSSDFHMVNFSVPKCGIWLFAIQGTNFFIVAMCCTFSILQCFALSIMILQASL